jgi:hypothetical protein
MNGVKWVDRLVMLFRVVDVDEDVGIDADAEVMWYSCIVAVSGVF